MAAKPLAALVAEALARDKRTKSLAVDASAIGAQVLLTGTVPSPKDRQVVEQVVRAVAGVAGVQNEIRIGRVS